MKFYKIGFYILLVVVLLGGWMFVRANPMKNEGTASWVEMYSYAPEETIKFLNENFGIVYKKSPEAVPNGMTYNILRARHQFWPFAGIMGLPTLPDGTKVKPHTVVYLTVKDYDAARAKMLRSGAQELFGNQYAAGMKFGIYTIPGDIEIGIAQYGVKN